MFCLLVDVRCWLCVLSFVGIAACLFYVFVLLLVLTVVVVACVFVPCLFLFMCDV